MLSRPVFPVEDACGRLRFGPVFFADPGVAVGLVFTLTVLAGDVERRSVFDLVTVLVFIVFLTLLSELTDLFRPCVVVFLEIRPWSPF